MALRKRSKLKMVCPKVFTTGTPRMYSTASEDMVSSEFWYSFIAAFISSPIIPAMKIKAMPTGTRHKIPSRQSKNSRRTISPKGVKIIPALSGQMCAR